MVELCHLLSLRLVISGVEISFQGISGWILGKIMRDWMQVQKGNSYLMENRPLYTLFIHTAENQLDLPGLPG
jgi:hypothetical protein